jgi:hypothetical protein
MLSAELCGAPTHRVVELVQEVEPGVKKSVALLKRSHRRFFTMASLGPHERQNNAGWLKSSCNPLRAPGATQKWSLTSLGGGRRTALLAVAPGGSFP